jgi:hypothetical protein
MIVDAENISPQMWNESVPAALPDVEVSGGGQLEGTPVGSRAGDHDRHGAVIGLTVVVWKYHIPDWC